LDDNTAIVNIGFDYNWFGNDLTQLFLSSNGVLVVGDYYSGSGISFANGDLDPSAGGAVKVGRKSGADESFKVSFEDIQWYDDDEEINVQVELFPNGDIIFCYGSGEMGDYYNGNPREMVAGVENSDLGKAFPIPDDPFDSFGRTTEWPTNSCWKFQMP
jgi:hypothetical protein